MKRLTVIVICLALAGAAHAGRSCEEKATDANTLVKSMDLAQKTLQALDTSGAQVALVARAGQDLSKYNVRYSHMALAWRDHPQGRWLVVHELNECGTAQSSLYNEGLGNFFMDDVFMYETLIMIPNQETQQQLARLLASNTPKRLHEARYNMLAYPYSTKYQNSNQWVLETFAAASNAPGMIETRAEAQSWLRSVDYTPQTLNIPATTRLGARMFRANIAFDDHPFDRRMAGKIDAVTVDSVARFVRQREPNVQEIVVK
ncbi:DUF2145 domain-containing protein [Janthinobacterium sp.]|uniref:DUF2145 domain-containing protein n=1 Tax=Janthinobacterium sp. TaxID=1871054 RepID=UPI002638CAE0|nr:DUF2145 domain-containing protein [Janthinobacterium sp.]